MEDAGLRDKIARLFDQTAEVLESDENRRREKMWAPDFRPAMYEPGLIPPFDPARREETRPPLTADWDRMQWSRLLGFDIERFYTEPVYYLRWLLELNLYRFRHFPDDVPLTNTVPIFLSVALEPNFFGVPIVYSKDREPLFTSDGAVIKEREDLARLKVPDFYHSGLMPRAHQFYETMVGLTPSGFEVEFPVWLRAPFGVACGMRSMQQLLIDMVIDPELVHDLMQLIVESRIHFSRERRKFLGKKDVLHGVAENSLANDEVSIPIVSPELCEEFVFPYEKQLDDFYGGIHWWHSCGNKTPLIGAMKRTFSQIEFMDFALWADDLAQGVRELDGAIPFHVRPNGRDISERIEEIIINHLNGIFSLCRGQVYALRIDGFQPDRPDAGDVDAMRRYLTLARKVSENVAERGLI